MLYWRVIRGTEKQQVSEQRELSAGNESERTVGGFLNDVFGDRACDGNAAICLPAIIDDNLKSLEFRPRTRCVTIINIIQSFTVGA